MGAPTTVNTVAAAVNQAINAAMGLSETAVESLIIADVPFLGLPGIKQALELVLGWVEGYFYTAAANTATAIVIDLQVGAEVSKTQGAFNGIQTAIASGDPVAIQAASQALDASFAGLVGSDGSAPA